MDDTQMHQDDDSSVSGGSACGGKRDFSDEKQMLKEFDSCVLSDFSDDDEDSSIPNEDRPWWGKWCAYCDAVVQSEGFDVPELHLALDIEGDYLIYKYNLKTESIYNEYATYSQLAIEEYNKRHKDKNSEMELVQVLKGNYQEFYDMMYYVTFKAKDVSAGGVTNTYQAVVREGPERKLGVASLRLEPGPNNPEKEWLWEDHIDEVDLAKQFRYRL